MLAFIIANRKAIIMVAIAAALFAAGWQVHVWKVGAEHAAALAKQKADYISEIAEREQIIAEVAEIKQRTKIIYREVRHEATHN